MQPQVQQQMPQAAPVQNEDNWNAKTYHNQQTTFYESISSAYDISVKKRDWRGSKTVKAVKDATQKRQSVLEKHALISQRDSQNEKAEIPVDQEISKEGSNKPKYQQFHSGSHTNIRKISSEAVKNAPDQHQERVEDLISKSHETTSANILRSSKKPKGKLDTGSVQKSSTKSFEGMEKRQSYNRVTSHEGYHKYSKISSQVVADVSQKHQAHEKASPNERQENRSLYSRKFLQQLNGNLEVKEKPELTKEGSAESGSRQSLSELDHHELQSEHKEISPHSNKDIYLKHQSHTEGLSGEQKNNFSCINLKSSQHLKGKIDNKVDQELQKEILKECENQQSYTANSCQRTRSENMETSIQTIKDHTQENYMKLEGASTDRKEKSYSHIQGSSGGSIEKLGIEGEERPLTDKLTGGEHYRSFILIGYHGSDYSPLEISSKFIKDTSQKYRKHREVFSGKRQATHSSYSQKSSKLVNGVLDVEFEMKEAKRNSKRSEPHLSCVDISYQEMGCKHTETSSLEFHLKQPEAYITLKTINSERYLSTATFEQSRLQTSQAKLQYNPRAGYIEISGKGSVPSRESEASFNSVYTKLNATNADDALNYKTEMLVEIIWCLEIIFYG
ncbi:unnamed protein product [Rodentolepis nana]|uniref:J domain-containing protein n=1 Tax=Rodentolepis nana TaxID=102285 RepID=A0A0R3TAZ4_RODNA|nr:unnamed protein product [Rodentolepis nana]